MVSKQDIAKSDGKQRTPWEIFSYMIGTGSQRFEIWKDCLSKIKLKRVYIGQKTEISKQVFFLWLHRFAVLKTKSKSNDKPERQTSASWKKKKPAFECCFV